jgi:hypothetical protein
MVPMLLSVAAICWETVSPTVFTKAPGSVMVIRPEMYQVKTARLAEVPSLTRMTVLNWPMMKSPRLMEPVMALVLELIR